MPLPEDVPPPPPAEIAPAEPAPAEPAPAPAADEALLAALLHLHGDDPEGGITLLAAGGDPRALPVLRDVVSTRRAGPVVELALRALPRLAGGLDALGGILRDEALPLGTREEVLVVLGEVADPAAGRALVAAASDAALASRLRTEAQGQVKAHYPELLPEVQRASDAGGVAWTMTGAGVGLGYALATAGYYGQTNLEILGAVTGSAGGVTGGWFLAQRRPVTAADASFVTLASWAGAGSGMLLTDRLVEPVRGVDYTLLGGLGGMAIGTTAGVLLAPVHPGRGRDAWEEMAVTGATTLTTGAWYRYAFPHGERREIVDAVALTAGFAGAAAAAPVVHVEGTDFGFIPLGGALGTLIGLGLPVPDDTRGSLPLATTGTGALAAWGTSTLYQRPGDELLGAWTGLATGATLTAGVTTLVDPEVDVALPLAIGGTAGVAGGMLLANQDPAGFDGTDLLWGSLATGWLTWQAAGWGGYTDLDNGTGILLTVAGGSATASAIGSRWVDVPAGASLTMGSTALWGTYLGATTALLIDEDPLLAALIGGDAGLAVGAVALAPRLRPAPALVGLADAGGVLGGGTTALVAALFTQNGDAILAASLVGAGAGTVGGALLGMQVARKPATALTLPRAPRLHLPGTWSVAPLATESDGVAVGGLVVSGVGW